LTTYFTRYTRIKRDFPAAKVISASHRNRPIASKSTGSGHRYRPFLGFVLPQSVSLQGRVDGNTRIMRGPTRPGRTRAIRQVIGDVSEYSHCDSLWFRLRIHLLMIPRFNPEVGYAPAHLTFEREFYNARSGSVPTTREQPARPKSTVSQEAWSNVTDAWR
jgi:hypothetical protein